MYCGRCGGFYNQACTHWPLCAPAPNPYDRVSSIRAVAEALSKSWRYIKGLVGGTISRAKGTLSR